MPTLTQKKQPKQPSKIKNKIFKNDDYEIFFNPTTGLEILQGINGKPDPFYLELPSLLDVGIMGSCKHKCSFCYQGHTREPNMKIEDFKTIIDQVKNHTNQIALGGRGDPNHHEHFKEIVEYARKNNVVPNYTTSGIGLTTDQVKISKMCGAVAVSDYEQSWTYKAINKFIRAGIKTNIHQMFSYRSFTKCIQIIAGYHKWVKRGIGKKRYEFNHRKLNAVVFLLFKPQGAGRDIQGLLPLEYHLKVFADYIFNPKCSFKVGMDSCLVNHVLRYVEPNTLQKISIDTCEAARMSAYITPDMRMTPCSFCNKRSTIPITEKKPIMKIWNNSGLFKTFRNNLKHEPKICPIGF